MKKLSFGFIILLFCFLSNNAIAANAVKWYRNSAEKIAIYREIFLLAEKNIKENITRAKLAPHQWGIILDVDETILDNSMWNYQHDTQGNSADWDSFAAKGISVALPGAKQFLDNIHRMGGYINLVTNRKSVLANITHKNLKKLGLYYDQILFNTSHSNNWYPDKNQRFNAIIKGSQPSRLPAQKIIAWIGDNIQDFPGIKQRQIFKQSPNSKAYGLFGVKYFALPNPMYGSWENT